MVTKDLRSLERCYDYQEQSCRVLPGASPTYQLSHLVLHKFILLHLLHLTLVSHWFQQMDCWAVALLCQVQAGQDLELPY